MKIPSKEQAAIYRILSDLFFKAILSLIVIVIFLVISWNLIFNPTCDWKIKGILGAANIGLGQLLMVSFKHYFPSNSSKKV